MLSIVDKIFQSLQPFCDVVIFISLSVPKLYTVIHAAIKFIVVKYSCENQFYTHRCTHTPFVQLELFNRTYIAGLRKARCLFWRTGGHVGHRWSSAHAQICGPGSGQSHSIGACQDGDIIKTAVLNHRVSTTLSKRTPCYVSICLWGIVYLQQDMCFDVDFHILIILSSLHFMLLKIMRADFLFMHP